MFQLFNALWIWIVHKTKRFLNNPNYTSSVDDGLSVEGISGGIDGTPLS
jgi:hypothetical protein